MPPVFYRRRLHGRRGLKFIQLAENPGGGASPPSRAAWIEIRADCTESETGKGRRLHGRRGLKSAPVVPADIGTKSPPSRAAWIEMR